MGRKVEWHTTAEVVEVVDGDTIKVIIDLGWKISLNTSIRIEGINAPEMGTINGSLAKNFAETLVEQGEEIEILSRRLDKYGRSQGKVTLPDGRDFAQVMVESGHAVTMNEYGKL
jgi:endonuclease YncB( thermonuclease family)